MDTFNIPEPVPALRRRLRKPVAQSTDYPPEEDFESKVPLREKEKPVHRAMVCLYVEGHSIKEIAERLGYTQQTVSIILRQPWAKELMREMMNAAGVSAIYNFLQGQAADSLVTITELRDDPTVPPATRLAACNSLLDRLLGKPTQRVETFSTNLNVTSEDAKELEMELERLRKEEARLLGQSKDEVDV